MESRAVRKKFPKWVEDVGIKLIIVAIVIIVEIVVILVNMRNSL